MDREELKSALARELDEWAKVSFDELKVRLKEDVSTNVGRDQANIKWR